MFEGCSIINCYYERGNCFLSLELFTLRVDDITPVQLIELLASFGKAIFDKDSVSSSSNLSSRAYLFE